MFTLGGGGEKQPGLLNFPGKKAGLWPCVGIQFKAVESLPWQHHSQS